MIIIIILILHSKCFTWKGESPQPPPMYSIHLDDVTAAILCQNAYHTPAYWWRGDRVNNVNWVKLNGCSLVVIMLSHNGLILKIC